MFNNQKRLSFSIRKFSVGVASALIGVSWMLSSGQAVAADDSQSQPIRYRYILESELSAEDKARIVNQLDSQQVNNLDTYYMVYRPVAKVSTQVTLGQLEQDGQAGGNQASPSGQTAQGTQTTPSSQTVRVLPQTNADEQAWLAAVGGGLLLLGVATTKGKRRKVLMSLLVLTASGQVLTVSAIEGTSLAGHNKDYQLAIGAQLPETVISIPGYEFVGYIAEDQLPGAFADAQAQSTDKPNAEANSDSQKPGPSTPQRDSAQPHAGQPTPTKPTDPAGNSQPAQPLPQADKVTYEKVLEPVAFTETRIADDQLEAGTERVVTEGQEGQVERTIKVTTKADGTSLREEVERREVKAPVAKVVAVGTKIVPVTPVQPVVSSRDEVIVFDTEYVEDPSRPLGEEVVTQAGQNGLKRVTLTDGQVTGEAVITEPVKQIISRGSQTVTPPVTSEQTEVIPYQTEVVEDPSLDLGNEVVAQAGQNGLRSLKLVDGQVVSSTVVQEPIPAIIKRGTKVATPVVNRSALQEQVNQAVTKSESAYTPETYAPFATAYQESLVVLNNPQASQVDIDQQTAILSAALANLMAKPTATIETKQEPIAFETQTVQDPTLLEGTEEVKQAGRAGLAEITYTNGVETGRKVITEAQPKVVHVGTKKADVVETKQEPIAFETQTVQDPTLLEGTEEVKQVGRAGLVEITYTNGVETGRKVITESQPKVVHVGTKKVDVVETKQEPIAFETQTVQDATLLEGTEEVKQDGRAGLVEITYTNGVETGRKLITEAQPKVVHVGTKKADVVETKQEPIAFETQTVEDATLLEGTEEVKQEGRAGLVEITYTNGVETGRKVITEAQPKVVHVGTKKADVVETKQEPMAFETQTVQDPALLEGTEEVKQEGRAGLVEITYTNGVETGRKVIAEAQPKVVHVGTKKAVNKEPLETAIAKAQALTATDYSPVSWEVLTRTVSEGQTVLAKPDLTQADIDGASQGVINALAALTVDRIPLETLVGQAQALTSSDYSTATWAILDNAVKQAQTILAKPTPKQSELNASQVILKAALDTLGVDKGSLTNLVQTAQGLSKDDYSPESWENLQTALTQAQTTLAQPKVKQSELNASHSNLQATLDALNVDKTALTNAVQVGEQLAQTDYSSASWKDFATTLAQARQVLADTTATQAQVNHAQTQLNANKQALTVDKEKLKTQLALAGAVDRSRYTAESLDALDEAVAGAQTVPDKQSAIDFATSQVEKALAQLGILKTKPTLDWTGLVDNALQKAADATYTLTDPNSAYQSAQIKVYDGERLVQTLPIADWKQATVTDLDYDVPYRLVTEMTYDLGNGSVTEEIGEKNLLLELKKIEIKDVDRLTLNQIQQGNSTVVGTLTGVPNDVANYFVRVTSDRYRDLLLPVDKIEAATFEGKDAFKVTVTLPELVEDTDKTADIAYTENFSFYVPKGDVIDQPNVFTNFTELVNAMTADPAGTYTLGADLFASDFTPSKNSVAYVTPKFTGKLIGSFKDKPYAIYGLTIPLFKELAGQVSDLDLREIAVSSTSDRVGSLAKDALTGAQVSNVSGQGKVNGMRTVGGLIGKAVGTELTNLSFEGTVLSGNQDKRSENFVGGLIGRMEDGNLDKGYVNADIEAHAFGGMHKVSSVIGSYYAKKPGKLSNLYAKGTVTNLSSSELGASGLVGSIWQFGRLGNAITEVKVIGGGTYLNSDTNHGNANIDRTSVFAVQDVASAKTKEKWVNFISADEAKARVEAMNLTATTTDTDTSIHQQAFSTDYTTLNKASQDKAIAYRNMEKLLPFYDKGTIVKYGNKLKDTDKLYTTEILSVTPMIGDEVVSDVHSNKTAINQLMVHYADKTVAYLPISYKADFKNTAISEYSITGTDLLYTPELLLADYTPLVNRLTPILGAVDYKSRAVVEAINGVPPLTDIQKRATDAKISEEEALNLMLNERMDKLYLEQTFNQIKANLTSYLPQLLATDKSANISKGAVADSVVDYISDNKEKLLLGLAYMQRWYNIDFAKTNIQDLATYHQDFYGKPVNTIEWLVGLAGSYANLQPYNSFSTYQTDIAPNTGLAKLDNYLTDNRQRFTDYEDDNTWFKASSKAYITETASKERPDAEVKIYPRLLSSDAEKRSILPLLTAQEGIFVISNMTSLTYGMFDRYMDMGLKDSNPTEYAKKLADVKKSIDQASKWQGDYFDFWYRVANEDVKERLVKANPIPTWDGYKVRGKWLPMFGEGANQAILDFFGPIERGRVANNGSGAYANGSSVFFVNDAILSAYGTSVFTHEMTHNLDGVVFLGKTGRRTNTGAEYYALGNLQSVHGATNSDMGINMVYDFSSAKDNPSRIHNVSPDRFQTQQDLDDYVKRMFDLVYTLEYAEAEVVLAKDAAEKKARYNQLEVTHPDWLAVTERKEIDDNMTLTSIADLVNNDIISDRYGVGTKDGFGIETNGYWRVWLFDPIYATGAGPKGIPGDLMYRRMAYEMMAYKGYANGYIPYTSNQLKEAATQAGLEQVTDDFIISTISEGQYQTMKEFKIAMFEERRAQADNLKPITFTFQNQTHTISSYEDLKDMIQLAVETDLVRKSNTVGTLKHQIYSAYLRSTDDFRSSIYK